MLNAKYQLYTPTQHSTLIDKKVTRKIISLNVTNTSILVIYSLPTLVCFINSAFRNYYMESNHYQMKKIHYFFQRFRYKFIFKTYTSFLKRARAGHSFYGLGLDSRAFGFKKKAKTRIRNRNS